MPQAAWPASLVASTLYLSDGGAVVKYEYNTTTSTVASLVIFLQLVLHDQPIAEVRVVTIEELHAPTEEGRGTRGGCPQKRSSTKGWPNPQSVV